MRKIILIAHTSLDGFIAGENGSLDGFEASEENLQFVCSLTEQADAALFGRISYQLLDSYWPTARELPNASKGTIAYSNWYNDATKIVISKSLPKGNLNNTIIISENISKEMKKIKQQPGKDILIFGSASVSQLLIQSDLVDSYWIFINPIIFGKGIALFENIKDQVKLKLLTAKQFPNGEISLNYLGER